MNSRDRVRALLCVGAMAMLCSGNLTAVVEGGVAYPDPAGGWTYTYDGSQAIAGAPDSGFTSLDGSWSHDNGSDEWDGTGIGAGRPGGVSALTEADTSYLRLQDTGDPRDYGMGDPGSNRKVLFGHNISAEGASDTVMDDGVTLSFRARVATSAPLDNAHPDGGGGTSLWPAGGDGYVNGDGGKHSFTVKQAAGGIVSFALAVPTDVPDGPGGGLLMNSLNGNAISGDVDTGDGTLNLLGLDATAWHEFWITIESDATDTGTHLAKIYQDGDLVSSDFLVTAGDGSDFNDMSYLAMSVGSTGQSGAVDIDFFSWTGGVVPPVPEPSGMTLLLLGVASGLAACRRRRG